MNEILKHTLGLNRTRIKPEIIKITLRAREQYVRIRDQGSISARSIAATIITRAIAVSVLHLIILPQLQLRG